MFRIIINNNNNHCNIYWFIYQVSRKILVMTLPITGSQSVYTQTRTTSRHWSYIKDQSKKKVQECRQPDRPVTRLCGQGAPATPTCVYWWCRSGFLSHPRRLPMPFKYGVATHICVRQLRHVQCEMMVRLGWFFYSSDFSGVPASDTRMLSASCVAPYAGCGVTGDHSWGDGVVSGVSGVSRYSNCSGHSGLGRNTSHRLTMSRMILRQLRHDRCEMTTVVLPLHHLPWCPNSLGFARAVR